MKNYTLSLSRWHKVAERLSRAYLERTQSARSIFINTQVSGYLGETQIARLRAESEHGMVALQQAFAIQECIASIRQAIGEANARVGVSNLLARHDAMTRRQKLLDGILAAQSCEMIFFDEIAHLPAPSLSEDRYDRSRNQIPVRTLTPENLETLKAQAADLQKENYALADQISDLNREKISIGLPEEIASTGGL